MLASHFQVFAPQGRHVALMGVQESTPPRHISPPSVQGWSVGHPKEKVLCSLGIQTPHRGIFLARFFMKFSGFVLIFKIWWFAQRVSDLWGLKLVTRFPQIFRTLKRQNCTLDPKKFGSARMVRTSITMPSLVLLGLRTLSCGSSMFVFFLFVCVFVRHTLNGKVCVNATSSIRRLKSETISMPLERGRFADEHPRSNLSLCRQIAPTQTVKFENAIKFWGFRPNGDTINRSGWNLAQKPTPQIWPWFDKCPQKFKIGQI